MMTTGWAVKFASQINVATVSPHERGAMVNALYLIGITPMNDWDDERIKSVFDSCTSTVPMELVEVRIEEAFREVGNNMFTIKDIHENDEYELDQRIRNAVKSASRYGNSAYLRVYCEDWFRDTIEEELRKRGFIDISVPDFIIEGDVYFAWPAKDDG